MRPSCLLTSLLLAALTSASPIATDSRGSSHLAKKGEKFIDYGRRISAGTCGKCDLSKAVLPQAPIPLPPPTGSLSHVVIGRGTQNYTCDTSNATAVPVAAGAVATLFNVTCLAVESPDLVARLPNIALDLPIPYDVQDDSDAPSYYGLSGYHYFLDGTTAFFNLDTEKHSFGEGAFRKANASDAPKTAMVGPKNKGNGAVPWLLLKAAQGYGGVQAYSEVYRVGTAGGSPPKTCVGQKSKFEIQYATEYWFYV
ncbi:hypothetical protein CAC42_7631 [Sphaceloma murrayae]|uniref:Malate dehydrogenase n=1 Tax=Sphaceloma murrayae TaxID=2082308 RepID=A0A2K1QT64_9PEZI|nr:hypothetical protein CAC42_7631 [Sphaceloma murrayae]